MTQSEDSQIALERRLLYGLSFEWETARWMLPPQLRQKMRPPLFSIRAMEDRWGSWSREKREISVSRNLIHHHSWDALREVLLHEMAHQLADEVLLAFGEVPHGAKFLEACTLLRANPRASGKFPPLDERLSKPDGQPSDRIFRKVQKLLALAQSPNPHEAQTAMLRAHGLMAQYNGDLAAREERRSFVTAFLGKPALRHGPKEYALAHLLQDHYFVQGIWVPAYVVEKGKMGRVFEISGTLANVQIATYVYDFIIRFIDRQWREYNRDKGLNHFRERDFALGIIEGFRSKLRQPSSVGSRSTPGLLKIDDPQLSAYMAYRYPHARRFSRRGTRRDPQVVSDGRRIGSRLVIAKGISSPAGNRGLMIQDRSGDRGWPGKGQGDE
jgi:hypothetical protein